MNEKKNEAIEIKKRLANLGLDAKRIGFDENNFYSREEMCEISAYFKQRGIRISPITMQKVKYKTMAIEEAIGETEEISLKREAQMKIIAKMNSKYFIERFMADIPGDLKQGEYIETPEYEKYCKATIEGGKNVIIGGKASKGKTRCAIEIARAYINSGGDAVFCSVNGIVFWQFEMIGEFIKKIKKTSRGKPYMIILDDIVEDVYRKARENEEWKKSKTQTVIKELFSSPSILIITTNNRIENIKKVWDGNEKVGKIEQRIYRTCFTRWEISCPICKKTIEKAYGVKTVMMKKRKCPACHADVMPEYEMIPITDYREVV